MAPTVSIETLLFQSKQYKFIHDHEQNFVVVTFTQLISVIFFLDTAQLSVAPELLRMGNTRPPLGTKAGDTYSFAIILTELYSRAEPYHFNDEEPDGAYKKAKLRQTTILQLVYLDTMVLRQLVSTQKFWKIESAIIFKL